ncbi:MAG: OmpA family protein [Myxococcota bacterium]
MNIGAWMLLMLGMAHAQEAPPVPQLDAELYRFPVDAQATLWADDAGSVDGLAFYGLLGASHLRDAYNYQWDDGETQSALASGTQLSAVAGVAWNRIRLGLDLPVTAAPGADLGAVSGGLGDIALDFKGTLLRREDHPVGLAVGVRGAAPTGTADAPVISEGATADLTMILDRRFGPVLLAANGGVTLRPEQDLGDAVWGPAAIGRLGVGYTVRPRLILSTDLASQIGLQGATRPGASPVEALVGATTVGDRFRARLGVGTGLNQGVGAPALRVIASVGYHPVSKPSPPPPELVVEAPPPPPPGQLQIRIVDSGGQPLNANVDIVYTDPTISSAPPKADLDAGEAEVTLTRPDTVRVTASADGYTPASGEASVEAGEEVVLTLTLVALPAVRPDLAERIQFHYDTATLTVDARNALDEVAGFLGEQPGLKRVRVDGYASAEGAADYNLNLSQQRAQAVVDYLVARGVEAGRLSFMGHGEVGQEGGEAVLAPNRRVELSALEWDDAAAPAPAPEATP